MAEERNIKDYIRVSDILYPFSGLEKINADVVENAARRGTKVHQICEGIIAGIGEIGVDEETWGYVESFKQWWDEGHEVLAMEKRFWDDELLLTGQVDLILKLEDGIAIVDLKTSARPSKTWPVQGCAYAYLAKNYGYDITRIMFLHLNKHGKPPTIHEYDLNITFFMEVYRTFLHFFYKRKDEQQFNSSDARKAG